MEETIYIILRLVVSVAAALATCYLIPYIKAKTSQTTQESINAMVATAVKAAEQTLQGGAVKKDQVVADMSRWLSERGIKVDAGQLDALIESIVYEVKQKKGGTP